MPAQDFLIVEDGSGTPDANSYVSYADFTQYLTVYNYKDLLLLTESQLVSALLKGKDYVDTFSYKGVKTYSSQFLQFPRLECFPTGEQLPLPFDSVPTKVKRAQMAAAIEELKGVELLPTISPSDFVKREKVGPIETEYSDALKTGMSTPSFYSVDSLLKEYLTTRNSKYSFTTVRV